MDLLADRLPQGYQALKLHNGRLRILLRQNPEREATIKRILDYCSNAY